MSNKPTLQFWKAKNLGEPGSLESILEAILNMGFMIKSVRVDNPESPLELFASWPDYSEQVIDEIDIAYEKQNLVFMTLNDQSDEYSYLTLWFKLSWKQDSHGIKMHQNLHIYTTQSSQLFTQKKLHREFYAQQFLNIGVQMYDALRPEFGWIERCPSRGYTTLKQIEKLEVPHIYWANFFGPAYVNKLGEDFLANAPGWKKERLEDGGFLYVLLPHLGTVKKDNSLFEDVKKHFKVQSVRRKEK